MKILKIYSILTLVSLIAAKTGLAAVSISFDDGVGDPQAVTITPGSSFSFNLNLTSTSEFVSGVSYFFTISGLGGSGNFTITNRDITGSPYTALITDNIVALALPSALLDPTNNHDLGAGVTDILVPTGVGTHFIASFQITSNATIAPGLYTLSLTTTVVADDVFDEIPHTTNTYNITVIPEPGVGMLLGVAGLAGVVLRRRRAF